MNRREFLKKLSASGIVLSSPAFMPAQANNGLQEQDHFWLTVGAGGGWDTSMFCDPKYNSDVNRVTKAPLKPKNGGPMRLSRSSDLFPLEITENR